jgi:HK97 family phage portal protein
MGRITDFIYGRNIDLGASAAPARSSGFPTISVDQWAAMFMLNGLGSGGTLVQNREEIGGDFRGYIDGVYKSNGVVFACMLVRQLLFSEARFQFRQLSNGRPGDLFGSKALERVEKPWPNGTTGDLLTRMIQDADLAGNAYVRRTAQGVERLRPDWMTIVLGGPRGSQPGDLGVQLAGYSYQPGGAGSGRDPVVLLPEEVAHFAPIPDPSASYRGMSWLSPVVREIMGDHAASTHKLKFFENGATPNIVATVAKEVSPENFEKFQEKFEAQHRGLDSAYETLFLGGGADVKVIGTDMRQIDFKVTQGHGETRIAAAAGVPPIIVGLSEGLDSATYSNYSQARRRFADGTMRPLWRNAAGSLATIVDVPASAELWYDDRDIPFLQEDLKDEADIQSTQAGAIRQLVDAGFDADSVVNAVTAGDLTRLKHSGLFSVQLQKPGEQQAPSTNGQPVLPAPTS